MEVSRPDLETIEETFALAAKWIATLRRDLQPFAGPAVLQSADATLADIAGCLCLLDATREQKEFEAVVTELFERRRRKAGIQRLLP